MTDIANRTAFITGGANGIGLGMARSLAKSGVKLALVDLDSDALARAEAELGDVTQVATAVLDVRDRAAYARVADDVERRLGPVSILMNNAGVAGGAPANRLTYELWDWGMGINLDGVINGIQTFLPRIIARGAGGHIVNTASGAGLYTGPGNVLYCTAKFAVVGLSEALHAELQSEGIGVSVLCPGPVATDIIARTRAAQPKVTRSMSAEQRQKVFASNEEMTAFLANGVQPDAVGDMVKRAISDNSLYIHTDRTSMFKVEERSAALLNAMP
ncbi:MAG TPA: SDR family NAD(P)-dependent oxidoreductase [Sphingobium sp.]